MEQDLCYFCGVSSSATNLSSNASIDGTGVMNNWYSSCSWSTHRGVLQYLGSVTISVTLDNSLSLCRGQLPPDSEGLQSAGAEPPPRHVWPAPSSSFTAVPSSNGWCQSHKTLCGCFSSVPTKMLPWTYFKIKSSKKSLVKLLSDVPKKGCWTSQGAHRLCGP